MRTIRDGEPRTVTSTFTQLLGSDFSLFLLLVLNVLGYTLVSKYKSTWCLKSTETIRLIRDGDKWGGGGEGSAGRGRGRP